MVLQHSHVSAALDLFLSQRCERAFDKVFEHMAREFPQARRVPASAADGHFVILHCYQIDRETAAINRCDSVPTFRTSAAVQAGLARLLE